MQVEKITNLHQPNVEILAIKKSDIEKFWPLVQFMIMQGLKHSGDTFSAQDIKEDLMDGSMQLFIAFGKDQDLESKLFMVCVSRIQDLPQKRQLEVVLLAGKKRELWEDDITLYLEEIAMHNDCHRVAIMARPGWKKLGDKHGYKIKNYEFVKELI